VEAPSIGRKIVPDGHRMVVNPWFGQPERRFAGRVLRDAHKLDR
jgi:hypothetical protein